MIITSLDCGIKNLAVVVLQIEKINNNDAAAILKKLSLTKKLSEKLPEDLKACFNQYYKRLYEFTTTKRFKILFWNHINLFPIDEPLRQLKCANCNISATVYRTHKLGYCKRHQPKDIRCKPIKERSIKNITVLELNTVLVKVLDSMPCLLDTDYVLIEQQPTKNPKMKTLQAMIYSYFLIRGIVDSPHNPIKGIELVSPKHKLRGMDHDEKQAIKKMFKTSTSYCQRKNVSVQRTHKLLDPQWKRFLDKHPKADDLCDAFLQAYMYFEVLNNRKG